jgi:hypothetical protein
MKNFPRHSLPLFALGIAATLSGCSDATVDLQQQIAVLKAELEKARAEKSAVTDVPLQEKPAKPSAADSETLKQNYETAGRALRAALEKELTGVQLESFTLYQPKLEPHPHKSEFSMEFRSSGTKFNLDRIPVKGSLDGTWFFPSVEAVVTQIERVKAVALAERAAPAPPQPQPRTTLNPAHSAGREPTQPAMANKTVSVEWDTRGSATAPSGTGIGQPPQPQRAAPARSPMEEPARQPSPLAPPPPPARQGAPSSVMPAQREVQIKF